MLFPVCQAYSSAGDPSASLQKSVDSELLLASMPTALRGGNRHNTRALIPTNAQIALVGAPDGGV